MKSYDHKKIEKKWQKEWEKKKVYKTESKSKKKKYYVLDMFPYPSGEGLHVGHPKGYIATDILSRMRRMQGRNVLHPMGFDAFGLPAENYAIKTKTNPEIAVKKNVARYKKQLEILGLDYDWSREVNTTDPKYYKWTQWVFLKMLEHGLAYESNEPVNWCPKDKTVLANEDVEDGRCERCGTLVEKRPMRQWVLKITDYADRMLADLDLLDWPESIKESQRNWIGRSEGAEIDFRVEFTKDKPRFLILHGYTGRNDKNFIPWLKKELEGRGYEVEAPQLPDTDSPDENTQVDFVLNNCKLDQNTVVIGHSLGAVVAMKALMKFKKEISGLVVVAAAVDKNFDADNDERPYWKNFSWDYDYDLIKKLTGGKIAVISDIREKKRAPYLKYLATELGARLIESKSNEEHFCAEEEPEILNCVSLAAKVFTTRADTLFGATYLVLAPEHPYVQFFLDSGRIENKDEIEKYLEDTKKKTEIERTDISKEKTGVEIKGIKAINPATNEQIPVFVADYVLGGYGTGAIMAVPAHDERDFAFAKKYNLKIKDVVIPRRVDHKNPHVPGKEIVFRDAIIAIIKNPKDGKYLLLKWKKQPWTTFVMGGIEDGEDPTLAAEREIKEETGYRNFKLVKRLGTTHSEFYAAHKGVNRVAHTQSMYFELLNEERDELSPEEAEIHDLLWVDFKDIKPEKLAHIEADMIWDRLINGEKALTEDGILINSGEYNNFNSEDAREKITDKFGKKVVKYRLKDWVFSRQRYWGEPIPVFHDGPEKVIPVPEKDLPVKLPKVKSYEPTGTGESPLAAISKWVNVKVKGKDGKMKIVKRETNTMPQWAGSSWYYLRYMDPKNNKKLVDPKAEKYWGEVDMYVGGAEHATRHLIYARFWHKFLYDIGVVSTKEPFHKLQSVGLIIGEDGRKMSKRFGNVVNPDKIVETWGADSLRLYEMFMGPFADSIAWNTDNMIGVRRFLEKVWRLQGKLVKKSQLEDKRVVSLFHKTVKKVGEDIADMKFNTAISSMMILLNEMEKSEQISAQNFEMFLKILAPFAPHITEEMWRDLGNKKSIHLELWPKFNASKIEDEKVKIGVQVNGKVRAEIALSKDASEDEVKNMVLNMPEIAKWTLNKEIKKFIYVPGRVINIVIA